MGNKWSTFIVGAVLAFLCVVAAPVAQADEGRQQLDISAGKIGTDKTLGIGLQGGPVSGLSLKYFLSPSSALQVGLGGSGWGVGLNVEYLVHPWVLMDHEKFSIPLYVGGGIGLGRYTYFAYSGFNVHVPVGISFELVEIPIDIFVQVEPGVGFGQGYVGFYWAGTSGARIFF